MLAFGTVSSQIGDYLEALILVYIIIILAHILLQMLFSFGVTPPYARWSDFVLTFMRDVTEPYLGIFRRFMPPLGVLDLSPMIAIILLWILRVIVARIFNG